MINIIYVIKEIFLQQIFTLKKSSVNYHFKQLNSLKTQHQIDQSGNASINSFIPNLAIVPKLFTKSITQKPKKVLAI